MLGPNSGGAHHRPNAAITSKPIRPTVGLNMVRVKRKADSGALKNVFSASSSSPPPTSIAFWDVGGQSSLRPLWVNYYPQCHGVIFVIDASTILTKSADVSRITRHLLCRPDLVSAPMAILFNKWDVVEAACHQQQHQHVPPGSPAAELATLTVAKAMDAIGLVDSLLYASSVLTRPEALLSSSSSSSTGKSVNGGWNDDTQQQKHLSASSSPPPIHQQSTGNDAGSCGFGVKVFKCFTVSAAATGDGVLQAFDWLLSQSLTHRDVTEDDK
ncbi:ADP-ribosylation factor-like, putative [Bodo saltans]|uniref:ADP-ribosylation factor-like, putative n=1 Tax=Bodo saltans TaxID=75058 RepID=A0A0S4J0H4_BODSA|nr:ADP-ribosylation factor-like, putative [Bodo saltans]|eukprot:CUG39382.1 ADP-ribosylation factor-like, putative [Bodo saltans]